uniref:Uncharacterized protein n=1 Tax=Brassica oleracea TaxID=3712 RepID=A0A3P6DRV1_BRAOL|nr:unnamed protein product [Brassica oleracea]
MARRHGLKPRATSQSDPLRSLPKARATSRSDMPRLSEYLHSQCFDIPQNWFDNHYTTTFVLGALKTPNIRLAPGPIRSLGQVRTAYVGCQNQWCVEDALNRLDTASNGFFLGRT